MVFEAGVTDPRKRWQPSWMDTESVRRSWDDTRANQELIAHPQDQLPYEPIEA